MTQHGISTSQATESNGQTQKSKSLKRVEMLMIWELQKLEFLSDFYRKTFSVLCREMALGTNLRIAIGDLKCKFQRGFKELITDLVSITFVNGPWILSARSTRGSHCDMICHFSSRKNSNNENFKDSKFFCLYKVEDLLQIDQLSAYRIMSPSQTTVVCSYCAVKHSFC